MSQFKIVSPYFIIIPCFLITVSSCSVKKYIGDNDIILRKNELIIETQDPIPQKNIILADVENIYKQNGISKFNAWRYYYLSKPRKDTTALTRYLLNRSKVPEIFSENLTESTATGINNYFIQRGYFNAQTDYDFKIVKGNWAHVSYIVEPGQRYFIDSLTFITNDTFILKLLDDTKRESHVRRNRPVDQRLYDLEVNRITNLLQNQGYANFFSNYVAPMSGDSTGNRVKVELEILPQQGDKPHIRYSIGKVRVFNNVRPETPISDLHVHTLDDVQFYREVDSTYFIKPKALRRNVFLRENHLYSRSEYDKTLRRLGRLGAVRFVTIRPEQDLDEPNILNYNIYISPSPKIALDAEIDINNSNISIINQRFLGFSGRVGIRNRNIFRGAEQNAFNVSGGVELNIGSRNLRDSTNYYFRIENILMLPKFSDYPGIFTLLNRTKIGKFRLINPDFYALLRDDGNTRFSINADFVTQRLFYSYTSLDFNYGYDLIIANRKRYQITQTGVNYFTPSFSDQFVTDVLGSNEFLRRSLAKQLFTGFFFRDLGFNYTSAMNKARETYTFFSNLEVSGAELALAGFIIQNPITEIGDIEVSKYVRLDLDGRYTRIYNDKNSAALRLNVGISSPYEQSTEVPFVKQFFVGGGLSIRAWQLRQLGPGSYVDTSGQRSSFDLFQTGDFKFEMNGEYRYRIWGLLETAVFVDVGNVWILKNDPERPGAQLTARNFVRDLAVGSGIGFRLVFDFFIIRLDWGVKVKNPYKTNGSYLARGSFRELTNLNLAIGYSF